MTIDGVAYFVALWFLYAGIALIVREIRIRRLRAKIKRLEQQLWDREHLPEEVIQWRKAGSHRG